ncbi:MAG: radical SAM family heme chaperone HemW [Xanthomonadales bacterium]|nr:radical SAM family heme chaperone HemW [Xanthomonadales bacterium]
MELDQHLSHQPLGLYVHLPWCVKKCPYCDFNSHALKGDLPAGDYLQALLLDLEHDLPLAWGRSVQTVYFGGGTPSLFSARQIDDLLGRLRSLVTFSPEAEITLEANPGTIERDSFTAYCEAGVNRVSLGAQSFDEASLQRIGRIHGPGEIEQAVESLHAAGLANFNIDLMYGLPEQTLDLSITDMERALACEPAHVSHYNLTLEPNTAFAANPPALPDAEACWDMQEACGELLAGRGFEHYEISAWARPGKACRHNLNYWRFGDYHGIGAGAHAKLTLPSEGRITRLAKQRHPRRYLAARQDGSWLAECRDLDEAERVFEYFLGAVRLSEPIRKSAFSDATGLGLEAAEKPLLEAFEKGLMEDHDTDIAITALGRRFNNDLQAIFLP